LPCQEEEAPVSTEHDAAGATETRRSVEGPAPSSPVQGGEGAFGICGPLITQHLGARPVQFPSSHLQSRSPPVPVQRSMCVFSSSPQSDILFRGPISTLEAWATRCLRSLVSSPGRLSVSLAPVHPRQ
jgi:hypothetical protein